MPSVPTTLDAYVLMHRGALALARVEHNGIKIDLAYLKQAVKDADVKISMLDNELKADPTYQVWAKEFGKKTNLNSDQQKLRVVFDLLKYTHPGKLTKGQNLASDAEVYENIDLPFVRKHTEYKEWQHVKKLLLKIDEETVDGLMHPVFNLHTTTTYRSSSGADKSEGRVSRDFNFQNAPRRNEAMAAVIRRCFIAREGCRLVENDFGAHEFKGAAIFWQDPELIRCATEVDPHRLFSTWIFKCDPKEVSKGVRDVVKNQFTFPILYGSYYAKIAQRIWVLLDKLDTRMVDGTKVKDWLAGKGIEELGACNPKERPRAGTFEQHVKEVEDRFKKRFKVFAEKAEQWWQDYRKRGWFRMPTGFLVKGILSRNDLLNWPIQGSCFHFLLYTLIVVQKELRKRAMWTLLVGQIHDCLNSDVPDDELQDYLNLVQQVVAEELPRKWPFINIPLEIEAEVTGVGEDWYSKKQWVKKDGIWAPKAA